MKRYLFDSIQPDLQKKMVFIPGPRQIGKTYLAKQISKNFASPRYLNYDNHNDARIIHQSSWPLGSELLILDELHKMKNWKNYIKGMYDKKPEKQAILVTGSARLETFRQTGESLAGRYFHHHLMPISVREASSHLTPYEAVEQLNALGGFPEPFLSGSERDAARWRNQYFTDIVREDILEFSRIHEVKTMRVLIELLRERVGSPISLSSLSGDLQVSPNTVKKYISILESLYIVYSVRPYHKNIARSILKEPKIYFYDTGYVKGDAGIQLENTTAVCLLKHCFYSNDTRGEDMKLSYLRTRDGREVNFVLTKDGTIDRMIEVKLSDRKHSKNLIYFKGRLKGVEAIQLVHNISEAEFDREREITLEPAGDFLSRLSC